MVVGKDEAEEDKQPEKEKKQAEDKKARETRLLCPQLRRVPAIKGPPSRERRTAGKRIAYHGRRVASSTLPRRNTYKTLWQRD